MDSKVLLIRVQEANTSMYQSNPMDPLNSVKYWWYWEASRAQKLMLTGLAILTLVLCARMVTYMPALPESRKPRLDMNLYEPITHEVDTTPLPVVETPPKYYRYVEHQQPVRRLQLKQIKHKKPKDTK